MLCLESAKVRIIFGIAKFSMSFLFPSFAMLP